MSLIIVIIVIAVCLLMQFLFSGSEMSIISCDRMRMSALAKNGDKGAEKVLFFLDKPETFFSTTLVGVNLSIVVNSTVLTAFLGKQLSVDMADYRSLISLMILWPLVLLFGEVIPMGTFRQHADTLAPLMARFLAIGYYLLYPITITASWIITFIYRILGIQSVKEGMEISKEELQVLLARHDHVLSPEEQTVIDHLFNFEKCTIDEMMVPLIDVQMVRQDATVRELVEMVERYGHSRIPIYKDRVDRVEGMVHISSVLEADPDDCIKEYMTTPIFIPETAMAQQTLSLLRDKNLQMAMVVDEFGGVQGIITVEDIIEEILGEIEDEYDKPIQEVRVINENLIEVDGKTALKTLQEDYYIDIDSEEVDTIAGFILLLTGIIPKSGTVLRYNQYQFKIKECSDRRISRVEIRIIKTS